MGLYYCIIWNNFKQQERISMDVMRPILGQKMTRVRDLWLL